MSIVFLMRRLEGGGEGLLLVPPVRVSVYPSLALPIPSPIPIPLGMTACRGQCNPQIIAWD